MNKINNELFEKYIRPEFGFIRRMCWKYCINKSEFQELHNEVLTNLFIYIHTYNRSGHIRPWLYTIIRRDMLRLQKKQLDEPIKFVDLSQPRYSNLPATDYNIGLSDVNIAVRQLDHLHRTVVELKMSGYKIHEIATIMYQRGDITANSSNIIRYRLREAYH